MDDAGSIRVWQTATILMGIACLLDALYLIMLARKGIPLGSYHYGAFVFDLAILGFGLITALFKPGYVNRIWPGRLALLVGVIMTLGSVAQLVKYLI